MNNKNNNGKGNDKCDDSDYWSDELHKCIWWWL